MKVGAAATDPRGIVRASVRASFVSARGDGGAAHVQVVPADVELAPGGSATFKVRLFDKNGNFLNESPAQWSLPLPPKTPTGAQPPAS